MLLYSTSFSRRSQAPVRVLPRNRKTEKLTEHKIEKLVSLN